MKKFVAWLAGLLLLWSIVFPNGLPIKPGAPVTPVTPVTPAGETDGKIVELLTGSDPADRARIRDVYLALKTILQRPSAPTLISTTEKWAELHARTLNLAIEEAGKYPTLDQAIEQVFLTTVGTDDVLPGNPDTLKKLTEACDIVANSASAAK